MKKIILLLLLSISLFAVQKQKQNQKVVLQLNWLHQYQFAGYYIAKEFGFYKDVGIDIDINEFNSSTDLSTILEKKEADFAVGRSSLLVEKANGKDVVALGAIFQESPLMLMTRDDGSVNSLKDLMGKRVMLTDDAKGTASIMAMLSSSGISVNHIQAISHSFDLNDLINGKVDAMACYISNEPIRMKEYCEGDGKEYCKGHGKGYKIFHPKDYGFHFYSDILFTSSIFIQNNPKLTKDFYKATIKGWEYAFENISETSELIYKHYNTQNKTLIQLIKEGEALKRLTYFKERPIGHLDKDYLEEIVNVYKVLGLIKNNIDFDTFIYEYNHPKEFALLLGYDDIFHILLTIILLLVIIGSILLFISLRKQWLHTQSNLKQKIDQQKYKIDEQNRVIMAQSKITAVGEMLNNIAHQWRQPLNIISLNTVKLETSSLLGDTIKNEDIRKISEEINRQSQYLSNTIDDFRNYFNSDVEKITQFDIMDTIKKVNELTKDSFHKNFIETVITTENCIITHNENLLIQAILNICNNASDAIIQSKAKYRYLFIDVQNRTDAVVISIKDSGGGIDENIITKIFEPYYSTKEQSKGTGLGLYITYEIITKHLNGTIEAQNRDYNYNDQKLRGAEFIITISTIS
ncbi:MAG: ABC transporter substrate-binding protein [Sulfurimonas sp.]|nr:ABC transporter substrate-binding protein [Sulfurimonas sp.]